MKNQLWGRRRSRGFNSRGFNSRGFNSRGFNSRGCNLRHGGLLFFAIAGRQQHGKRSGNH